MRSSRITVLSLGLLGVVAILAVVVELPGQDPSAAQENRGPIGNTTAGASHLAPASPSIDPPAVSADEYTPEERVNIFVYEQVNRSVVNITTEIGGRRFMMFEAPADQGAGSGSVIDRRGHILTNYHVIEEAQSIQVTLYDGNSYDAKLVGVDPSTDVAVLKIDAPADALVPVGIGDSTRLKVGQRVFAIGNPFGLERTLTTGIVSSLNRSLPARNSRKIKSIIQIDAAINPGNSGGPLLDSHARLIGMNTAIASRTGQNTGVGFAIPASVIARVVPQLISKGRVVRPDSGITRVLETDSGLLIATLLPDGPAERAGLRGFRIVRQKKRQGPFVYEYETVDRNAADLIVAVDSEKVVTADDFLTAIETKQPGQEVTVDVIRGGRKVQVPVQLAEGE